MHPQGWVGRGTGERGEPRARRGACPLRSGVRGASRCPAGVLAFFAACLPCLCFTFLPLSSYPLPRWGRGRPKLFHARGFAPCIPGAGRGAALGKGANHAPGGGRAPYRARLGGHPGAQRGCLPSLPPAHPAFALLSCPYPPNPLPGGKGEILGYFMQGASPLASPGLNLYGAGSTLGKQFLWVMSKTFPFNNIIEKSSGGSGGLFQESPSVFPFLSVMPKTFPFNNIIEESP